MMEFSSESVEKRKNRVLDFLNKHFQTNGDEYATKTLAQFTRNSFFSPYFANWQNANRSNKVFLPKYQKWLEKEIVFPEVVIRCLQGSSSTSSVASTSGKTIFII